MCEEGSPPIDQPCHGLPPPTQGSSLGTCFPTTRMAKSQEKWVPEWFWERAGVGGQYGAGRREGRNQRRGSAGQPWLSGLFPWFSETPPPSKPISSGKHWQGGCGHSGTAWVTPDICPLLFACLCDFQVSLPCPLTQGWQGVQSRPPFCLFPPQLPPRVPTSRNSTALRWTPVTGSPESTSPSASTPYFSVGAQFSLLLASHSRSSTEKQDDSPGLISFSYPWG